MEIMKIKIDREKIVEVRNLVILIGDKEFTISVDKFEELIINKENYGNGKSSISISPRVSNEIGLI